MSVRAKSLIHQASSIFSTENTHLNVEIHKCSTKCENTCSSKVNLILFLINMCEEAVLYGASEFC